MKGVLSFSQLKPMFNFSQLLAEQSDAIIEQWMQAVREDKHMDTDDTLSVPAVRDHVPLILHAIVTVLSQHQQSDLETLASASLEHGVLRAEQGFNPAEVAREYRLLRSAIFSQLETVLINIAPLEVYRVFRLINMIVDEALAQSFKSYVNERMKELEQLQQQVVLAQQEINRLVRINQDSLSQQLTDKLRTPLSSAIGYTELFLRQQRQLAAQSDTPRIEHIERALNNNRHLLRLINDTTELLRYEHGQLQLHLLPTNAIATVQQTVQLMEAEITAKALQVVVDYDDALTHVQTDPLRLQQIVTNLLSNAIQYTESGTITIQGRELPDQQWSIAIHDTGIGISPADQAHIFEPYFRVNARSSKPNSTGLGLAIVLRLVKLLHGTIAVDSEVGVGSTFTIQFPKTINA